MTSADLDIRRRRAAYRAAHRGTKEMDWLLGKYAAARLDQMNDPELAEFEEFLAAPDPDLQHWIMDPTAIPDDRYAALVRVLRGFHELPQS
jgi:antitoxin CptB